MSERKEKLTPPIRCLAGFTLIELIATLIVIGILAVIVTPRFFGTHGFEERGFHDETIAALRYAQKAAIAQHRLTCVTFTAKTVSVRIASTNPPATAGTCDTDLQGADGKTPFLVDATADTKYRNADVKFANSATLPSLTFDPLGRSNAAATLQVYGHTSAITIEAETGYVH